MRSAISSAAGAPGATTSVAPSTAASAPRSALGSTTTTRPAPAARTHCNVASPIGPAPCTTAVSPSRGGLDRTAWNATVNGSTCAACSSVRVGSVGTTREAATASRGAKPPWGGASASRPTADRKATWQRSACPARQAVQSPHAGAAATTTRWPSVNRRDVGADGRDRAGPLVAADRRVVRAARLVGVHVGPADAAERDVDDDALRCRRGLRELAQLDGRRPGDQRGVHGPAILAPGPDSGCTGPDGQADPMDALNLGDYCRHWARWRPDAIALWFDDRAVTWRELDERTDRLAAGLAARGVVQGDRVAVLMGNRIEWVELTVALLKLGALDRAAEHPLQRARGRLRRRERRLPPRRHRGGDDRRDGRRAASGWPELPVHLAEHLDELHDPSDPPPAATVAEDAAYLCYTSGTTGDPKGAVLTHGSFDAISRSWAQCLPITFDDVFYLPFPLAFTGGLAVLVWSLVAGCTVVLDRAFEPGRAIEVMEQRRVTALMAVPLILRQVVDHPSLPSADLSAWRTACSGGAAVPPSLLADVQALGVPMLQMFGLTESSGDGDAAAAPRRRPQARLGRPAGPPHPGRDPRSRRSAVPTGRGRRDRHPRPPGDAGLLARRRSDGARRCAAAACTPAISATSTTRATSTSSTGPRTCSSRAG